MMSTRTPSPFIQHKIHEIQDALARPVTAFETGGFRPTGARDESWIGRVFLCTEHEADPDPVTDRQNQPLYPLAQLYLPGLPFVPEQLRHITYLTVFVAEQLPYIDGQRGIEKIDAQGQTYVELTTTLGQNGDGWLIREYTADDVLIGHEFAGVDWIKPFPLKPVFKAQDFPLWDGGGVPDDMAAEICTLEDYYNDDKADEDRLNYYEDIVDDKHSYTHKLGGYPSFCQSGIDFGEYEFVLQISSDGKANFNVVDNGSLMFARHPQTGAWVLYYDFY